MHTVYLSIVDFEAIHVHVHCTLIFFPWLGEMATTSSWKLP